MKDAEKIPVYIRIENGRTVCICHAGMKACRHPCQRDMMERDVYRGWESTMRRNRYGQ